MTLDFAAGGFGNAAGFDQHDGVGGNFVFGGDRFADRLEDLVNFSFAAVSAALDFGHDHQAFALRNVDGESRGGGRSQQRMAALDGLLDILRIIVAAVDDQQIFQAAGDEQFALVQETQIASAQVRAAAGVFQEGAERGGGFIGLAPVALGYAGAGHPNFADAAIGAFGHGFRIDDHHFLIQQRRAAPDQRARAFLVRQCIDGLIVFNRFGFERTDDRVGGFQPAGDHQRRFGQTVAGIERLGMEAARRESAGELCERFGANRFGAVEGQRPTAEIEMGAFFRRDASHAQIVGEVWSAADRAFVLRDRLQPTQWPLQKRHRRHEHVGFAVIHRLQDAADQSHVVIAGQPEHAHAAASVLERIANQRRVVHQIGVAEHDALGRAGGTGGVLQEGQCIAMHVGLAPIALHAGRELIGRSPMQRLQVGVFGQHALHAIENFLRGERDFGLGVVGDRFDPLQRTILARWIGRHRHHAGIQAAEEGGDKI